MTCYRDKYDIKNPGKAYISCYHLMPYGYQVLMRFNDQLYRYVHLSVKNMNFLINKIRRGGRGLFSFEGGGGLFSFEYEHKFFFICFCAVTVIHEMHV